MARKTEDGFWLDSTGQPVPPKHIRREDKERDKLVETLIKSAQGVSDSLAKLKMKSLEDIEAFIQRMEEQYKISTRTKEGNKILRNFSGDMKIEVNVGKVLDFDEKLNMAKTLIDNCIKRWSKGSSSELKVIVNDAFRVDKKGKLDRDRVLSLLRLQIKDDEWSAAMNIIKDSMQITGKRMYIQFWQKDKDDKWVAIPLDISRVEV